jgi:hypothetical protein
MYMDRNQIRSMLSIFRISSILISWICSLYRVIGFLPVCTMYILCTRYILVIKFFLSCVYSLYTSVDLLYFCTCRCYSYSCVLTYEQFTYRMTASYFQMNFWALSTRIIVRCISELSTGFGLANRFNGYSQVVNKFNSSVLKNTAIIY